jgi:hypothetical protein
MRTLSFKTVTLTVLTLLLGALGAGAQDTFDQVQNVLERSSPAIAKLLIRGTGANGANQSREGTAFFIYSGNGSSLLVSAAHVVGSSETEQSRNPDWKVENGRIDRHIEVLTLDEHKSLISRTKEAFVLPDKIGPGVDLTVLMINQDGFKTLPIANTLTEPSRILQVMLLGFPASSNSLSRPSPIGIGQRATPILFAIKGASSQQGESGGPWIDIKSGTVFAVARGQGTWGDRAAIEGTPISLVLPSLVGIVPREQWQAWQEAAAFRDAQGEILKLKAYLKSCQICAFKVLVDSEIASLEGQAARAQKAATEAEIYRSGRGAEERLNAYIASCTICEFKDAALSEVASLQARRNQSEIQQKEATIYDRARGNVEQLQQYASTCTICEYKQAALSELATIGKQRQLSDSARREAKAYTEARGDLGKLRDYIASCQICELKSAAKAEVASLETQERHVRLAQTEAAAYAQARGNPEKLRQYASSCEICEFKNAASVEATSIVERQKRIDASDRESKAYRDARGNADKLKGYLQSCAVCEFKATALSELTSLSRQSCDRMMATQFDADLPSSVAFVGDAAALSSADIDQATSDCSTSLQASGNRRYATQAGRAYAARAKILASTGNEAKARSDMKQALTYWNRAAAEGSGTALNFLGAYFVGTFNTNGVSFVTPDNEEALKYWLKGSAAGNVRAMGNAGAVLLEGSESYPPVVRNISRGRSLLEQAIRQGNMAAASELGRGLFYNWPSELGRDVSRGLELLSKACAAEDRGAREFFEKEMRRDKYRALLPAKAPKGCETSQSETVGSAAPVKPSSSSQTYWNFNDSVMSLAADGSSRKFYYSRPRSGLEAVGVKEGTLFFEGTRSGNSYVGKAYVFSKYCGALAYDVTGTVSADQREVVLSGKTPRRNATCQVLNYSEDTSVFTFREPN